MAVKKVLAVPDSNKSCGECSMCCKLFEVGWLDRPKPAGQWCHHCRPGKGCAIWNALPDKCLSYYCIWRIDPALSREWRPDRARFILTQPHVDAPLMLVVDPNFPKAHQSEPYASRLRATVTGMLNEKGTTIVIYRRQARSLLFPDEEVAVPEGIDLSEVKIERHQRGSVVAWRAVFPNH